jgi:hypothetical protein
MIRCKYQAQKNGRRLSKVLDNTGNVNAGDILLFCTLRNELTRIPYFLQYYRELGVNHFMFVDNGSTDGFQSVVQDMSDVSVWYTEDSYKASNFGMHWLNYLLSQYGAGHWCVTCDPDEFLVYPHSDSRNLHELGRHLQQTGKKSLFTLMLDMYDTDIVSADYHSGDRPWDVCPYFDKSGYSAKLDPWLHNIHVQGGVRKRVFYAFDPDSAPALNKIPFVKWQGYYSYLSSMHCLLPRSPNEVYSAHDLTGCLLHFKFISLIAEKSEEEMKRGEHYDDSSEYRKYHSAVTSGQRLHSPEISVQYRGWQQLVSLGLMSPAEWIY